MSKQAPSEIGPDGTRAGYELALRILQRTASARASDADIQPDGEWSLTIDGAEVRQTDPCPDRAGELIRLGLREFGGAGARSAIDGEEIYYAAHKCHAAADFTWRTDDHFVRVHIDFRLGMAGVNFRLIPATVPRLADLGVPAAFVKQVLEQEEGLILVAGSTGSGKSSTLAATLQYVLDQERLKVVTYESPVEFRLKTNVGVVIQKEIGSDSQSFLDATESAMRENASIVMLGEMRDPQTILSALRLSATGHLVIGTIHSGTARGTVERLIESAPETDRAFYRNLLASTLRAVLCQRLIRKKSGGRMALHELFLVTDTVRALIADDRRNQIHDQIMRSPDMMTFSQCGAELVASDLAEEALVRRAVSVTEAEWSNDLRIAREHSKKPRVAGGATNLVRP